MTNNNKEPEEFKYSHEDLDCDLLVVAAGFEDRAFRFISEIRVRKDAYCLLIGYRNGIENNSEIHKKYKARIEKLFQKSNVLNVQIAENGLQKVEKDLTRKLYSLPTRINNIWIDISGLPTYGICAALNALRTFYPNNFLNVIYTEAKSYHPEKKEYDRLLKESNGNIEFLPKSMALEMSEVLMLESFSGHRSEEGRSCLAIFCGYEVHRSAGVIESINPSLLLLLHGKPGNNSLTWRLDLAKQLHNKFEGTRKSAIEEVSTLNPFESVKILKEYYQYLFEDYDFTISPVCSKMQVVGMFLFWEEYREVQLVFPLPIGYSIEHQPVGFGKSYVTILKPRNTLYHETKNLV
ncbi:hypothetical protein [Flagellimonas sp. 2504JD4-2]